RSVSALSWLQAKTKRGTGLLASDPRFEMRRDALNCPRSHGQPSVTSHRSAIACMKPHLDLVTLIAAVSQLRATLQPWKVQQQGMKFLVLVLVLAVWPGARTSGNPVAPGAVLVWGDNEYGQASVPVEAQSGVTAIAAG